MALDDDERRVDHDAVRDHQEDTEGWVPQREYGRGCDGPPVGELGSTGLADEQLDRRGEVPLADATREESTGLGEPVLPPTDAQPPVQRGLERTDTEQPPVGLQTRRWDSVGGVAGSGVDDRPPEHVGDERAQCAEGDQDRHLDHRIVP